MKFNRLSDCSHEVLTSTSASTRVVVNVPIVSQQHILITKEFNNNLSKHTTAILISHPLGILGLPFITEYSSNNKYSDSGIIDVYATEPVIEFGRILMLQLLQQQVSFDQPSRMRKQRRLFTINHSIQVPFYTRHDIEECVKRIKRIHYKQIITLAPDLQVKASSAGSSLGSCVFTFTHTNSGSTSIYIPSCASFTKQRNSTTSTSSSSSSLDHDDTSRFMKHAAVFDLADLPKGVEEMVVARLSKTPTPSPPLTVRNMSNQDYTGAMDFRVSIERICDLIAHTLETKSTLIILTSMTDTMFDLIGIAATQIRQLGWSQLPLHIVGGWCEGNGGGGGGGGGGGVLRSNDTTRSGSGGGGGNLPNQALQIANIFGEWMSKEYQRELYKPLKPLPHGRLLDSKLLHLHSSMHQLLTSFGGGLNSGRSQQQPLIVFSPYVHFGDGGVKVGGVDDNYHRDNNNNNHDHLILSLIGDLREIIEDQAMDISSTCFVYTDPDTPTHSTTTTTNTSPSSNTPTNNTTTADFIRSAFKPYPVHHLPLDTRIDAIDLSHILHATRPRSVTVPADSFENVRDIVPSHAGINVLSDDDDMRRRSVGVDDDDNDDDKQGKDDEGVITGSIASKLAMKLVVDPRPYITTTPTNSSSNFAVMLSGSVSLDSFTVIQKE